MIMKNSPLTIPADVVQSIGKSDEEIKIALAIFFYKEFGLSTAQAAGFAEMSRVAFLQELGKRKIPINYDASDELHDAETMRQFNEEFTV